MLIQIILAIILGVIAGTLTGLIPGIHINLIGVLVISLATSIFYNLNPIYLVTFITSMAITHTFLDFIPSIFLGCPDTDTELSVLPGHKLLKKGHGYQAIVLTAYGSLAAIFILILITIPSIILISKTYEFIQKFIPYFLILMSIILISLENKKLSALLVFFLTGFLGWSISNFQNLNQPLFPLLTGLFGSSMLILSIKHKTTIPEQKIIKPFLNKNSIKPLLGALIASPLCSFLPGLGSGQAAVIGHTLFLKKENQKGFLILLGATNTLVMGFSFLSLYIISKTRTGASLAIQELISTPTKETLILILLTTIITGIIAFCLTLYLAKIFSTKIHKLNYTIISTITLLFLMIIVTSISGFLGLLVLIISTLTGLFCINLRVRRTNMMGCLLIPTIIFYLF
jgi:putative membrane protein